MGGRAAVDGPFPGDDGQHSAPAFAQYDDDSELDEHFAWLVRELDAGRVQPPPESALEGPAISISLGDACDVDPELLAAVCGPDGLGGETVSAAFGQDEAADALRPGPVLAVLTAQAASSPASLTDNELIGKTAVRLGIVNEEQVLKALGEQLGMKVVKLGEMTLPSELTDAVNETMATSFKIVPRPLPARLK